MPEVERAPLLATTCRCLPTLEAARIRCDQTVRSQLRSLAVRPCGLTFIQGGHAEGRTYLLTALGHAYLARTAHPRRVAGFEVHQPDWFVPVPGVECLPDLFPPALIKAAVRRGWPKVVAGRNKLVLLNGIWSALPALRPEIVAASSRFPVLVADAAWLPPGPRAKGFKSGVNLVTVSQDPAGGNGLLVEIHAQ